MTARQKSKLVALHRKLEAGPYQPTGGWHTPTRSARCEILVQAGFAMASLPLAAVAFDLLAQRQPDTVRGVMYSVVSKGWLPDTGEASYGKIQRLLHILRTKRLIPYAWIVDNIRSTEKPSSWSGLADFADTVAKAYRKNFWAALPHYVCIIVEKDTVAGRVAPTTRAYDVPLHPLRGFSSTSFTYAIAEQWKKIQKPINVYYIGDHDPSGRDIERSIRERLADLSGRKFNWKRLAVEPEHFEQFDIIPLKPKKKDTRYERFAAAFGEQCAEVEAIPADVLRSMVDQAILSHIPADQWKRLKEIEAQEKQTWTEMMGKIKAA